MPEPLCLDLTDALPADWLAALAPVTPHRPAAPEGIDLVRDGAAPAPEMVVILAAGPDAAVARLLAPWRGEPPFAVLLLTPEPAADGAAAERALAMGVHHWAVLETPSPRAVAHARLQADARWRRERALRETLARAQATLEERKWVDRAKGVLMSARGIDEDAAFRLLRGAAMNVNLRMGEVSRAVFESARWAEAVNRAGQLRMLSQRCVRLVAQRLLRIDGRAAAALLEQSAGRVRENLALLAGQCAGTAAGPAQATARRRWEELEQALAATRIDPAGLTHIDACAEGLLSAAERLVLALQEASGRRALHIVDLCGRQRLRVQRIAKESLLAALPGRPGQAQALARRLDTTMEEFEATLRELEQAPLSSADIRALLAQVREEWLRVLGGRRARDPDDGRRALAHASETLLDRLETLTAAYEHSLHVIMG